MELNSLLVSIIMPAYDADRFIKQAIDCILNQSYTNWELLIADDASNDYTKNEIQKFSDPRIKCFHNVKNLGYLETWNKLMKEAKGEFITFQDADDLCHPNRIELLLNALIYNPRLGAVGSNFKKIDLNNQIIETSNFPLSHQEIYEAMPNNFYLIGSAIMIRKKVYQEIGGYHSFFNRVGAEDYYWIFRVMEKYMLINIREPLYYYRFNENSVSGNISSNPSKINITTILTHLINQRKKFACDDLQNGNDLKLKGYLGELNKPFLEDPSYYFYYVAKRRFYEGHKNLAIKNIFEAIRKKPLKISYYRDLFYFLRN